MLLGLVPAALATAAAGSGARFSSTAASRGGRGWLILDFDAIFCGACFEPVLALLRALPAAVQEDALTAVLLYGGGDARRRVIEAKWDGLRRVHGWTMPAVLDSGPGLRDLLETRTSKLLLFDVRSRSIRAHDLPLSGKRFDAVLSILIES
ncbi:MAG: hypothetical protein PHI34_11755 [Acidobacteriota bacterium]|nr:hypothetical protein [Acidobacteriota bacterium]